MPRSTSPIPRQESSHERRASSTGRSASTRAASTVTRSNRPRRSVTGGGLAGPLLDHLVRLEEDRLRDREAEHLRGLDVDHQLELCGLLDGKIAWPGPL